MKKLMSFLVYSGLLLLGLSLNSCQEEFDDTPQGENQEAILATSNTAKLIQKVSSKDGSYDNIVDKASCFSLNFPYVVNVNGLDIKIDAKADLKLIERVLDELEDDNDILEIVFPVTITMADYSEITINNQQELREQASKCIEGGDDDDIECIDFSYPLTVYSFNINLQKTNSVTVQNDLQLRRFFKGLNDNSMISFDFPLALTLYDGTEINVANNAELADAIEMAKDACDEDDDDDYNDDDFSQEELEEYLVKCPWLIKEIKRDGQYQTDQYFEYVMNFKQDGSVVVKDRLGNSLAGTWTTRVGNHRVLLKLEFDVLTDFTLEWLVYDLEDGKIKLFSGEGNKIVMRNACDIIDNKPDTLREVLKECSWIIRKVKKDGEEIDRLLGYEFKFMAEGVVSLSNGTNTSEGTWAITSNAQGRLIMDITMGQEPGVNFSWPLSDLRDKRLKFEVGDFELILERNCNNDEDDDDVMEIRDILKVGSWMVAQYKDDGEDKTAAYANFGFSFAANALIRTTNSGVSGVSGLWRVIRNSEGELKCYLNFGLDASLRVLSERWSIKAISSTRIELENDSDEVLVFEKE